MKVAVEQFDQTKIGKIAIQRRARALSGFLDRMHRELERETTGFANALAGTFGKFDMVAVTRRQIRTGLGNTDDGFARLQFFAGDAPVHVALDIERRHVGIVRIREPLSRPEI